MARNTLPNNGKSRELLQDVFRYGLPCRCAKTTKIAFEELNSLL